MYIRPELQALRGGTASQRHAQTRFGQALAAWRNDFPLGELDRELAGYAGGAACEDLPLLQGLFDPRDGSALRLCGGLVERMVAAAADAPLGHIPLRHSCDEAITALVLGSAMDAALTLQAIDGSALARSPRARSACFAQGEIWEHVLAGSAEADVVRLDSEGEGHAVLSAEPDLLGPGDVRCRHGAREVLHLRRVSGLLVSLKLHRRGGQASLAREYSLETGELLHQAASNPRDSQLELAAVLLGRMGRSDAAPLLAAMAEEEGSTSLRWQALREAIALDTECGFAALCRLAAQGADPLAAPAEALRTQLLQSYPELAGVEPCPA